MPWPPFAPFLKDTAMRPASLFNPEMLLRIVWRDTRWIAMRRDKRDDDLAPFDGLPRQLRIQNKVRDKTVTVTLQPAVRISGPPAVQTAYFWITGSDAVIAFTTPMAAVPLDNVYRIRMAALGTVPDQVISLLDVTSAHLQSTSGYYQYRWTPTTAALAHLRSYGTAQGERQSGTSIWFEDVVGHAAVPEQVLWQRSPWVQVTETPSLVALGTPTQLTVYASDAGTGTPLTGSVLIGGTVVANTGVPFTYTFTSSPGAGVVRVGTYFDTPFSVTVADIQQLRAAVRNLAFGIWLGRVRAGGRYWGDTWSDWFAAKAQLGIPPDVHV
jgi:hypothetical protein